MGTVMSDAPKNGSHAEGAEDAEVSRAVSPALTVGNVRDESGRAWHVVDASRRGTSGTGEGGKCGRMHIRVFWGGMRIAGSSSDSAREQADRIT